MMNLLITPDITVNELLNEYPQLEDKFIEIAPVFSKLKNPILRKTIARVTTLKQASVVGGVEIGELINKLRKAVGQDEEIVTQFKEEKESGKPNWVTVKTVKFEYDASIDINNGMHPVAKVTKEAEALKDDEIYILITPFIPAPLIDVIRNKGYETFTEERGTNVFATYISRK
ncbi:MAG: DUF1858 domain-containing protein [Melioribacteraceae bacterium]|jgi:hypothetical protein|nr:DUF1858 domain-containing protein [Melioribacteraceae bacterium]RJP62207.1 MAG: DUF1858 domain-containing protein [Ignavibacteriales bacterium]